MYFPYLLILIWNLFLGVHDGSGTNQSQQNNFDRLEKGAVAPFLYIDMAVAIFSLRGRAYNFYFTYILLSYNNLKESNCFIRILIKFSS